MKKTKIVTALVVLSLWVVSLVACGGCSSSDADAVKYLTGTITDASMNTLSIHTGDGHDYTFSTVDADMSGAAGLEIGSEAEVYYTGTIDGEDTSDTTVVRVVQSGQSVPASSSRDDGTEHSVTGTILDSDGATLVVRPQGQAAITFEIAGADANDANGLVVGDQVTVYYTGTLNGTDASGVTVTRVTQDPATTPNANAASAPRPPAGENSISGVITYSDGATLTVQTDDGTEYTFEVVGADASGADGLVEGDEVTVYYTGQLNGTDTSGTTVVRLEQ